MTVGELRKALEAFDQELTVIMDGEFLTEIGQIEISRVVVYSDEERHCAYGRGVQFDDDQNAGVDHVVIS